MLLMPRMAPSMAAPTVPEESTHPLPVLCPVLGPLSTRSNGSSLPSCTTRWQPARDRQAPGIPLTTEAA